MLLCTLGASLLGNLLTVKGLKQSNIPGPRVMQAGEGAVRAGELMPPHPLNNFEKQKYYQNQIKFDCVYSRINLPKIKDGYM